MCSSLLAAGQPRPIAEAANLATACMSKPCFGRQGCPAFAAAPVQAPVQVEVQAAPVQIEVQAQVQAPAVQPDAKPARQPIAISNELVADILKPYRPNARYLKSAAITSFRDKGDAENAQNESLVSASARFAIEQSCYIDDTGHFNAVEFNICFNQLAYVMFGKCIEAGLLHRMRSEKLDVLSLAEFKRHQLPSMVIVNIESRYYKQLDSSDFRGELTLDKVSSVGDAWFFFTTMTFSDSEGVKAKGKVVLAFSPSFTPVKH